MGMDVNIKGLVDSVRPGSNGQFRSWHCLDEEQLGAFVEQQMSAREKENVEKHLGRCAFCRDQVGFLVRALEEDPAEPAPAHWIVKAREKGRVGTTTPPLPVWRWGAVAGATACAVLAVALWLQPGSEIRPVVPAASPVKASQVISQNEPKPLQSAGPSSVVRNQLRATSLPEVLFPKANSVVAPQRLEFRWKEMKGALSYEARLVTPEGDVLWDQRVEARSATLPSTVGLHPGETYFLWIRAYLPEGKVVQSKATRFTVAEQK
jgi:hypothetical protein